MKLTARCATFVVVLAAGAVCPADDRRPLPQLVRLDNGLRAVIVEDHALPLVSVQLWMRVGSAQDPPGRTGLAHMLRTTMSQYRDVDLRMRGAGLSVFDETYRDACLFEVVAPAATVEFVLDGQRERLGLDAISAALIADAKSAVSSNKKATIFELDDAVERAILARLYPDHPYGRRPEDAGGSLGELTAAEAAAHFKRWFTPGNTTMVIVGDVSTSEVERLVRAKFGDLEWADTPRAERPARVEAESAVLPAMESGRVTVDIAWPAPRWGVFEGAQVDVLLERLCNAVDGPLYRDLKELGLEIYTWDHAAWRYGGMLVLRIHASPEQAKRVVSVVEKHLRAATTEIPEPVSHERARMRARRYFRETVASFHMFARRFGEAEVFGGDVLLAELYDEQLARVTVGDVQAAAQALLESPRVVVPRKPYLVFDPETGEPLRPVARGSAPSLASIAPAADVEDARAAVTSAAAPVRPLIDVQTHTVGDGVKLTVARTRDLRQVAVYVKTDVDVRRDTNVFFALRGLAQAGPMDVSGGRFADYTSIHGLRLRAGWEAERMSLCGFGPRDSVGRLSELLAMTLRRPNFAEAAEEALDSIWYEVRMESDPRMQAGSLSTLAEFENMEQWRRDGGAALTKSLEYLSELGGAEMYVVGEVDVDQVVADARAAWDGFDPPHQSVAATTQQAPDDGAGGSTRFELDFTNRTTDPEIVYVYLDVRLPEMRSLRDRFLATVLRRLLESPTRDQRNLFGLFDRYDPIKPSPLVCNAFAAVVGSPMRVCDVEALLETLRDARRGRIDDDRLRVAAAFTHHVRFTGLHSAGSIAYALAAGWDDPWRVFELRAAELRDALAEYLKGMTIGGSIRADHADAERLRTLLDQLNADLATTTRP